MRLLSLTLVASILSSCLRMSVAMCKARRSRSFVTAPVYLTSSKQSPDWLDNYARAERAVGDCWWYGGRYWGGMFEGMHPELIDTWQLTLPANKSAQGLSWPCQESPPKYSIGFCADPRCTHDEIVSRVMPLLLGHLCLRYRFEVPSAEWLPLGARIRFKPWNLIGPWNHPLPPSDSTQYSAAELVTWRELPLDFVLAGVDGCGSTSLQRNLAKHPRISFTKENEDNILFRTFGDEEHFLPSVVLMQRLQDHRAAARMPGRALGLYNAVLWFFPSMWRPLLRVPNLRLVLVVCDAVSALERRYYKSQRCCAKYEEVGRPCRCKIAPIVDLFYGQKDRKFLTETLHQHFPPGSKFLELMRSFGDRLVVVHLESIRAAAEKVYDHLAEALRVGPFPEGTRFHRFNSIGGRKTELCRNKTLLERLQRVLTPENEAIDQMVSAEFAHRRKTGLAMPILFREGRRITRCDFAEATGRPQKMQCGNKRVCRDNEV
eukprot:TRINITY_DN67203_c0_g1_i1.p1 TRINITY_DN67203_c0_g1~~TRINITY_DN67203_c0_g1_i1.p1  ORF type:complete len:489 (+),score=37.52 TRINITY_DN67203_c0_g1_i1:172-1638(+)